MELESSSERTQDPMLWLPGSSPRWTLESHQSSVNCVAFHPKFASLASGSDDCTIKIWDWEVGELERTIVAHTQPVRDLDYGGLNGCTLLASCSSDLQIKLWDPADDYKNIRTLYGHDHGITSVRFVSSGSTNGHLGNLLISASGDRTLKVWNVITGHCVKTMQGHTDWVRAISPSIDGRFALSGGSDNTARLWNVSDPGPDTVAILFGHANAITCCALAPRSSYPHFRQLPNSKPIQSKMKNTVAKFMATGSRDMTIKLWNANGVCLATLTGHTNWVTGLTFHPGGRYLLSVSDDRTLRCWDLSQEGKCIKTLKNMHNQFITSLRWAEDTTTAMEDDWRPQIRCAVATASMDMKIKVFFK